MFSRPGFHPLGCAIVFAGLLHTWVAPTDAQLISIRTVPVSQAHQFDLYPSHTLGMGGASIALEDELLDPFSNPAMGVRVGMARLFTSPNAYTVTSKAGAGRTLPIGALAKVGGWFGGIALAVQEVEMSQLNGFQVGPFRCLACTDLGIEVGPADLSKGNTHGFAMMGTEIASGLSVGGSVSWSQLNAIDGVDLLYANSARVNQHGHSTDLRFGLLKEWEGDRSLEAVVVHNRFNMRHDVIYLDGFWDPGTQQFSQRARVEQNLDRTTTWGVHTVYVQPLASSDWRLGWLVTANRMNHPKIPNYEIMNIPRDPGNSSAFNFGLGISRRRNQSTVALDVIYEPIWSHTWADSESPIETAVGDTIQPGGMTIENNFVFSNAMLRMGFDQAQSLGQGGTVMGFQFGLSMRSIDYRLRQQDHVQLTSRRLDEGWVEWAPTFGLRLEFTDLEIRYRASVTSGTGRPGVVPGGGAMLEVSAPSTNILAAPSGPLTLGEVNVVTHQISFSIPLR